MTSKLLAQKHALYHRLRLLFNRLVASREEREWLMFVYQYNISAALLAVAIERIVIMLTP